MYVVCSISDILYGFPRPLQSDRRPVEAYLYRLCRISFITINIYTGAPSLVRMSKMRRGLEVDQGGLAIVPQAPSRAELLMRLANRNPFAPLEEDLCSDTAS